MSKKKARERLIFQEIYKKKAAHIRRELNPTLPHVPAKFTVADAYIESAGTVECEDGIRREFQVIRVYFDEAN